MQNKLDSIMTCEKPTSRREYTKHGLGGTPTYRSWYTMLQRCTVSTDVSWPYYGGKGIKVCSEWATLDGFVNDMGIRPDGMTLDRIDPAGNYEKANCRWATWTEQNRNRSNTVFSKEKIIAIKLDLDLGLTQRQVAKKYEVSQSNVSRAMRSLIWKGSLV
jgi:hypothetical protein